MKCYICNHKIPKLRLEVLPDTLTCAKCSDAKPKRGLMDFSHKTAPSLVMLPNNPEAQRLAYRAFRRAR